MSKHSMIDEIEVRLLLEGMFARYGYDLRNYAPDFIHRRVQSALANSGTSNLGELQHRILEDPAVFSEVLEDLTIQASDMFRDPIFYTGFRTQVLPILRTYPQLKIWHAGCATGEEVYATAILLEEEGLYERAQIYATDLSPRALEMAKQGIFETDRLAGFRDNYRAAGGIQDFSKYYIEAYRAIAIRESLRRNILFFQHDLVSDHSIGEMHVVFCRNVLIYFGKQLRARVIGQFNQSLAPGGFLCLGQSEQLGGTEADESFEAFLPEQRIYRYQGLPVATSGRG